VRKKCRYGRKRRALWDGRYKPYFEFLRKLGCFVVNWDPIEESFAHALQRQKVAA